MATEAARAPLTRSSSIAETSIAPVPAAPLSSAISVPGRNRLAACSTADKISSRRGLAGASAAGSQTPSRRSAPDGEAVEARLPAERAHDGDAHDPPELACGWGWAWAPAGSGSGPAGTQVPDAPEAPEVSEVPEVPEAPDVPELPRSLGLGAAVAGGRGRGGRRVGLRAVLVGDERRQAAVPRTAAPMARFVRTCDSVLAVFADLGLCWRVILVLPGRSWCPHRRARDLRGPLRLAKKI